MSILSPRENGRERADFLYDFIRNPGAHALGVHGKAGYRVYIRRPSTGLTEEQIDAIERLPARPTGLSPGISKTGNQWDLVVDGLYRDVFHMVWNFARNHHQMSEAEQPSLAGTIIWREGKP